jgi:Flp pilus assembly protein TadD
MKSIPTLAVLAMLVAGCASVPAEPEPAALTSATPEQMLAAIDAAAGSGEGELAVQPLRDPMVEDLREQAQQARAQGRHDDAAAALDRALEIVADDPALLQERAEAALLQREFERAGQLAERAFALGAQVGPLCRRHWATIEQARLAAGDADGAASAQAQVQGCTVEGPNRF